MPSRFTDRIIKHLASDAYEPARVDFIAEDLRISEDDLDVFQSEIDRLVEDERLIVKNNQTIILPPDRKSVV